MQMKIKINLPDKMVIYLREMTKEREMSFDEMCSELIQVGAAHLRKKDTELQIRSGVGVGETFHVSSRRSGPQG